MGRRRKNQSAWTTRCPKCNTDVWHGAVDGDWQIRITYLPDETSWLFWPCVDCGWQHTKIGPTSIARLFALGVRVDDLSLVDPGVCMRSITPATTAQQAHMHWLASLAHPSVLSTVISAAVDKILEGTQ